MPSENPSLASRMGNWFRNQDWTANALGMVNPILGMGYRMFQRSQASPAGAPLPSWMQTGAPMPEYQPSPWEQGGSPRFFYEPGYGTDYDTTGTLGVARSDQAPPPRRVGHSGSPSSFRTVISGQALEEMARNQMAPDLMTQQTGASRHLNTWAQKIAK